MPERPVEVRVDRIACTAHGVCHGLLGDRMPLDEWGYPVPNRIVTEQDSARALIRLCPASALRRITAAG